MRIGVFTPLLSQRPLAAVLKKLAALQINTVELSTGNYPGDAHCKLSMLEDAAALAEFQKVLADHGATISALSCHGNALHPDKARAKQDREVSRKTILLAEKLGVRFETIPILQEYDAFRTALQPVFRGLPEDVTEENLQARIRGTTLMAISNKFRAIVLTTGNKSELAVGYCTLYGDMCGGLAVISDVPKTLVYSLSRVANKRHNNAIPESVFTKPPSAELRPDQKDSDSLPEYDVLDQILRGYIENNESPPQISDSLNLPVALVRDIVNKVDRNEYKRQQAAPGLKVTTKAFGIGRRFPIAQRFSE